MWTRMRVYERLCVGIRTHRFGQAEQDLYRSLSHYFPQNDIFIVVDETRGVVDVPPIYNKIGFSRDSLNQLSLFGQDPKIGWLCGDYFYYFLHEHIRADAYWLIEPDVRFTFKNVDEFFRLFELERADVLLTKFGRRQPQWPWYRTALQISDAVYGCAFPLSRLSGRAIELLLRERQKLSANLLEHDSAGKNYPNDEAFVATASMKMGLSCVSLSDQYKNIFTHFSVYFPYLWPGAEKDIPVGKVVHPALIESDFWPVFNKKINSALNRSDMLVLVNAASTGLEGKDVELVRDAFLNGIKDWLKRHGLFS